MISLHLRIIFVDHRLIEKCKTIYSLQYTSMTDINARYRIMPHESFHRLRAKRPSYALNK